MTQVNSYWCRRSCPGAVQQVCRAPSACSVSHVSSSGGSFYVPPGAGSLRVPPPTSQAQGQANCPQTAPRFSGKRQERTPSVVTTTAATSSGCGSPTSVQSPLGSYPTLYGDAPMRSSGGIDRLSGATRSVATPVHQQAFFGQDDPHLQDLQELRTLSRLGRVPVVEGLFALRTATAGRRLTRERFLECYVALMDHCGVEAPSAAVQNAVFDFFDRDHCNIVDNMELLCGLLMFFSGSEEEKMHAVFDTFDVNGGGYVTIEELFAFLTPLFKVLLTPRVVNNLHALGLPVETAEDLASVASVDCFVSLSIDFRGKLSLPDFKAWYQQTAQGGGPSPFAPLMRGLC
jgi:Ca2+-binding EF-hand superfamily protein